jgi:hypothetical protein
MWLRPRQLFTDKFKGMRRSNKLKRELSSFNHKFMYKYQAGANVRCMGYYQDFGHVTRYNWFRCRGLDAVLFMSRT